MGPPYTLDPSFNTTQTFASAEDLLQRDPPMQSHASSKLSRLQRIRTTSISFGLMLGMVLGAYAPQMAHAARPKAKAKAERKAEPKAEPLAEATPEQLLAADRVLLGQYGCEFGKSVEVAKDLVHAGYVTLKLAKQTWTMKPVLSSTGALRLEDVKGQTLLLQILTKSMLMDVKSGHRVVDACVHDTQRQAEENLRSNPQPSNL